MTGPLGASGAAGTDRWSRLLNELHAAGVDVQLDTRPYPGGVSRSIRCRRPDGAQVEVHDKWWHENWAGWEVHLEDRESIVRRSWPRSKKRSAVLAAVLEAMTR